jgi:hypothetical protein
VPIQVSWNGSTIAVVGTAPIVLADYKIVPPNTSVMKVDDHGSLELSLTFPQVCVTATREPASLTYRNGGSLTQVRGVFF